MRLLTIPEHGTNAGLRYGTHIPQPLFGANIAIASGDTINTTNVETDFATTKSIPANTLRVGQVWHVRAMGSVSTDGATPGNWRLKYKWGTTTICQTASSAIAAGLTNRSWIADVYVTIISLGSSGTVEAQGVWMLLNNAAAATPREMPNSAVVTVNTTAAITSKFSITPSVSDAQNSITMRQFHHLLLNG